MLHGENQDIFNVLDLGQQSSNCSNNLSYHHKDTHIDFEEYYDHLQDFKQKIEELPSTNETEESVLDEPIQDDDFFSEKSDQFTENTPNQDIQTTGPEIQFSEQKIKERNIVYLGYDYQTQNLGKNLKISITSYLNMLTNSKDLELQEEEAAQEFKSSNGSLQNFKKLFSIQSLSQKCREYYQSPVFVQNIMMSSKMELKSKLAMFRFLQKFRKMTLKDPLNWKLDNS